MSAAEPFPRLTADNHHVSSPATTDYNCIAWALGDTQHWWQPGVYWPLPTPAGDYGVEALHQAFLTLGFQDCADAVWEPDHEKVALYGSAEFYTHAARQLPGGKWTSKLGGEVDIEHDTPEDVAGGVYGEVAQFMRRPIANG
jgi:hypothetical protein